MSLRHRLMSAAIPFSVLATLGGGTAALAQPTSAPAGAAQPASADPATTAGAVQFSEVVVTARRREERAVDVPVAITAMSKSRVDQFHATDLASIQSLSPDITVSSAQSGTGGSISIRGIGAASGDPGIEQEVITDVDGVATDHGQIVTAGMFDLQDVVILKGPQTLFFGKNSPAGVLQIDSVNPGSRFSGYVNVGYIDANKKIYADGGVSIPITPNLGLRIAFQAQRNQSFLTNVAGPLADPYRSPPGTIFPGAPAQKETDQRYGLRLTMRYTPNSRFDATLKMLFSTSRLLNTIQGSTKCTTGISPTNHVVAVGLVDPYSTCHLDFQTSSGTDPQYMLQGYPQSHGGIPFQTVNTQLGGLTMNYRMGDVTLTSVTGLYHYSNVNWNSFSSVAGPYFAGVNDEWNTTFNQEVRANSSFKGPLNFTAGMYFEYGTRHFYAVPQLSPIYPPDSRGFTNTGIETDTTPNYVYSPFVEARWQIIPTLELAGGVRYTYETKDGVFGYSYVNANSPLKAILLPAGHFIEDKLAQSGTDPQATLTWKPIPGLTIYGAYKTGFKAGGITNPTVLSASYTTANTTFKPESVAGEEGGVKWDIFEHTFSGAVTVYHYNFTDLQVSSFNQTTVSYIIENAASAITEGVEGQFAWQATPQLSLSTDLSYNHAYYARFPGATCYTGERKGPAGSGAPCINTGPAQGQDLSGRQRPGVPKFTAIFDAYYDQPLPAGFDLKLSGEVVYKSSYVTGPNYNPWLVQNGFGLFNATARLTKADQPWELALIGKNLTNKLYVIGASDIVAGQIGNESYNLGDPRTVAVQLTVRW